MKHSIDKIFQSLNAYMFFILFASFIALMLTLEHQLSVKKVENLNNQKNIIVSLSKLQKEDIDLALILFNGKNAQLHSDIEKLKSLYKYNITGKYILQNETQYIQDLKKLLELTDIYTQNIYEHIKSQTRKNGNSTPDKEIQEKVNQSLETLNTHIDSIIIKDMKYNEAVFMLFEKAIIAMFIIVLFATIWYRKRINDIYKDIEFLSSTEKNYEEYKIFSIEADAIAQRMKRKVNTADNPAFIDQVTGINNLKGLIHAYGDKRMKEQNFTSVTVLEVDNFSKSNRAYSQELTQAILKKIAFTISLHEQVTDVIARTDYNQFTIVFSRSSKEQAYKDIEIIRQNISELNFKTPKGENITVCGGYVIKPGHTSLEEAIRSAKEILNYTKSVTRNKIYQAKDIADRNL